MLKPRARATAPCEPRENRVARADCTTELWRVRRPEFSSLQEVRAVPRSMSMFMHEISSVRSSTSGSELLRRTG